MRQSRVVLPMGSLICSLLNSENLAEMDHAARTHLISKRLMYGRMEAFKLTQEPERAPRDGHCGRFLTHEGGRVCWSSKAGCRQRFSGRSTLGKKLSRGGPRGAQAVTTARDVTAS